MRNTRRPWELITVRDQLVGGGAISCAITVLLARKSFFSTPWTGRVQLALVCLLSTDTCLQPRVLVVHGLVVRLSLLPRPARLHDSKRYILPLIRLERLRKTRDLAEDRQHDL